VIGVDLGSEKAKIAVADLAGHIITLKEKSVWSWDDRSKLEKVVEGVKEVLREIPNYDPLRSTLGVGVPGVVDYKSGSVSFAPLFPSWQNYPLRETLEAELKMPTYLDNDVYAAAWGEYCFGAAKDAKSSLFVLVSQGIGGGFITEGKIYRGATGAAGELGYTLVDRSNLYMSFGEKGCLESLCSTSAMASKAKEAVKRGESPLLKQLCNDDPDALTPEIVCQAAIQNDPVASAIVEESREYLAVAIANAISVANPEIVVLGGDLAALPDVEELFVEPIRTLIKPHVPHFPTIALSSLTTNAVIYGAIVFALDLIQEKLVGTAI
jgi:glucokinase